MLLLNRRMTSAASALGILLFAATAGAQEGMSYELGAFVGFHAFPSGLSHSLAVGPRLGLGFNSWLGVEGELAVLPTSSPVGTDVLGLSWRAHLIGLIGEGALRPFAVLGAGGLTTRPSDETKLKGDTSGFIHTGIGVKYLLTDIWVLRFDGRVYMPVKSGVDLSDTNFEILAGLSAHFGEAKAAPPPPPPAEKPVADSDGDGIPDDQDKCPHEKGIAENQGCPDKDSDGDGIVDRLDKCPQEKGIAELAGCPDKDSDGDGIPDRLDKCPNEPETKNGYQDEDGCPDELPQAVKQFTGAIEGITFETGKDVIKKSSFPTLDKAASVLTENPSVRIEIGGHTDNVGKPDTNVELSQKRAEAVKHYLEQKGIDAGRLKATGYGSEKPVADNKTKEGRAKNRRVEFTIQK